MAFNFPDAPAEDEVFTPAGGPTYIYKNPRWLVQAAVAAAGVTTDDAAPSSPVDGQLWYKSNSGDTYIWYDDGNSQQWVQVNVLPSSSSLLLGYHLLKVNQWTVSGTWTPDVSTRLAKLIVQAAGGGGGGASGTGTGTSAGSGGGGGGCVERWLTSGWAASEAITISAAGTAGAIGLSGGVAGTTSIGSLVTATGGAGGSGASIRQTTITRNGSPTAGSSGSYSGGAPVFTQIYGGHPGMAGLSLNTIGIGGNGGGSRFGGGGAGSTEGGGGGTGYNGGGGGGGCENSSGGRTGGVGGGGLVIIEEYI